MNASVDTPRQSLLRKAAVFVLLAGLGGAFGYGVATLTDGSLVSREDQVAMVISVALIGILMGIYFIATIIAAARRGLHSPHLRPTPPKD